jgi:hypothetical protein
VKLSRWSVLIALVISLPVSFLLVRAGTSVAADEYSPVVETECGARVPTQLEPGERLVARVKIDCNTTDKPSGELRMTVRSGEPVATATTETAAVVWQRTMHYEGRALRVLGPRLSNPGHYTFTVAFGPDDAARFDSCYNEVGIDVGRSPAEPPDGDDPDEGGLDPSDLFPGGVLPNTGGPHFWLAVLALWLVLAGLGLTVWSRVPRLAPR